MRKQKFRILMHLNGLNYAHLWKSLVMAELAQIYIEWLSLASLLLYMALSHWTITCRHPVTQTQLGMPGRPGREAVLYIPFAYANQAYYQRMINAKEGPPPESLRGPCLAWDMC